MVTYIKCVRFYETVFTSSTAVWPPNLDIIEETMGLRRSILSSVSYSFSYERAFFWEVLHCKYIQRKDSGSAVKPLWFWKNTVVYHRPCFTVFFTSKNCNFSIILHVMLILLVFTAFKSTTKKTVKMALKNCKNGAKKMQTLKAIIKSDLQNMRIVFWRSLLKIKLKNLQIF